MRSPVRIWSAAPKTQIPIRVSAFLHLPGSDEGCSAGGRQQRRRIKGRSPSLIAPSPRRGFESARVKQNPRRYPIGYLRGISFPGAALFFIAALDILREARVADDRVAHHFLGQCPLGEADDGLLAVFLLLVDPGQHVEEPDRRAADVGLLAGGGEEHPRQLLIAPGLLAAHVVKLAVVAHVFDDEGGEDVLIQGIIDVYFVEDGEIVLADYKTDRVDSADKLIDMYKIQLELYKDALEQITGKKVKEVIIYSVTLSEVINVV